MMKKKLAVYIHIPFCVKKCAYCDFNSAKPKNGQIDLYVSSLKNEIISMVPSLMKMSDHSVDTVYIGGGTPSMIDAHFIEDVLAILKEAFEKETAGSYKPSEITIECNPGTVFDKEDNFVIYRRAGINRLSLGLQSANEEELAILGRIHTREDWKRSVKLARYAGFDNINTDLISGIPGQTWEDFKRSLDTVITTGVEHISVYSLMIEEGTPLYERYKPESLTEEERDRLNENDRLIYDNTGNVLKMAGYERYEISNYAKPGYECRHNIVYWKRGDYIGFGLGAASLIGNIRFKNTDSLSEYMRMYDGSCPDDKSFSDKLCASVPEFMLKGKNEVECIDKNGQMAEYAFLGLRMTEGISEEGFRNEFGISIDDIYADVIKRYVNMGMLIRKDGMIRLSKEGFNVSNRIMADFL